jgi:hypothetical protein
MPCSSRAWARTLSLGSEGKAAATSVTALALSVTHTDEMDLTGTRSDARLVSTEVFTSYACPREGYWFSLM